MPYPRHFYYSINVPKLGDWDEPGRTFRVIPREMWGVENNLSISNMDYYEFADSTDADGVFRGFPSA
ncbi:MAG: hypothetical protein ACFCVD_12050 [Nodosilinea sp.]